MAKQVNKTVIGVFVVSSIAMLIAGVLIFGSGDLFRKTDKYILFFEESVNGLSAGAPVVWHGVKIGSVSRIVLKVNEEKLSFDVPVIIEIDPSTAEVEGGRGDDLQKEVDGWIRRGLRARLSMQSFVTSQQMIRLDVLPDAPLRLTGYPSKYPEIPTLRSSTDKLTQTLEKLPIEEIAGKVLNILDNMDTLFSGPELKEMVVHLNKASKSLSQVVANADRLILNADGQIKRLTDNLNEEVDTLSEGMQTTMQDARKALKDTSKNVRSVSIDARTLLQNVDSQLKPLAGKMRTALISLRSALDEARSTLTTVNGFIGDRSDTRHKLNRALDEISGAAKSLHSFMEYLERHPEALLQGKGGRGR